MAKHASTVGKNATRAAAVAAPVAAAAPAASADPQRVMAAALLAQGLIIRHPWGHEPSPTDVGAQAMKLLAGIETAAAQPPQPEPEPAPDGSGAEPNQAQ